MQDNLKCCFTGYRPSKLPFDVYKLNKEYTEFENLLVEKILETVDIGCNTFYTGMAMGFDIIAAETVLLVRKLYKTEIKLVCVVPFKEQTDTFSEFWKNKYKSIIADSDEQIVLSDKYFKGSYQVRNKYMVDNCDFVLTWFDGKTGGTKNTIDYAIKKGRKVININNDYEDNLNLQQELDL